MLGKQVNWYRNASEKDNNQPQGTGKLVHLALMERTAEAIGVIVDDKGHFHEKVLSLMTVELDEQVDVTEQTQALENQIKQLEAELDTKDKALQEANNTIVELKKKPAIVKPTQKKE